MTQQDTPVPTGEIVAHASKWHRAKLIGVSMLFLAFGVYCNYDGYYRYPKDNAKHVSDYGGETKAPHSDLDINLNRGLGALLPPLGILLLVRALYMSRGQYSLAGTSLSVPGHPQVPLSAITRIDKRRWERKGIAMITYRVPGGSATRTFRLDDFYYDRTNTDAILAQIEAFVRKAAAPRPPASDPRP